MMILFFLILILSVFLLFNISYVLFSIFFHLETINSKYYFFLDKTIYTINLLFHNNIILLFVLDIIFFFLILLMLFYFFNQKNKIISISFFVILIIFFIINGLIGDVFSLINICIFLIVFLFLMINVIRKKNNIEDYLKMKIKDIKLKPSNFKIENKNSINLSKYKKNRKKNIKILEKKLNKKVYIKKEIASNNNNILFKNSNNNKNHININQNYELNNLEGEIQMKNSKNQTLILQSLQKEIYELNMKLSTITKENHPNSFLKLINQINSKIEDHNLLCMKLQKEDQILEKYEYSKPNRPNLKRDINNLPNPKKVIPQVLKKIEAKNIYDTKRVVFDSKTVSEMEHLTNERIITITEKNRLRNDNIIKTEIIDNTVMVDDKNLPHTIVTVTVNSDQIENNKKYIIDNDINKTTALSKETIIKYLDNQNKNEEVLKENEKQFIKNNTGEDKDLYSDIPKNQKNINVNIKNVDTKDNKNVDLKKFDDKFIRESYWEGLDIKNKNRITNDKDHINNVKVMPYENQTMEIKKVLKVKDKSFSEMDLDIKYVDEKSVFKIAKTKEQKLEDKIKEKNIKDNKKKYKINQKKSIKKLKLKNKEELSNNKKNDSKSLDQYKTNKNKTNINNKDQIQSLIKKNDSKIINQNNNNKNSTTFSNKDQIQLINKKNDSKNIVQYNNDKNKIIINKKNEIKNIDQYNSEKNKKIINKKDDFKKLDQKNIQNKNNKLINNTSINKKLLKPSEKKCTLNIDKTSLINKNNLNNKENFTKKYINEKIFSKSNKNILNSKIIKNTNIINNPNKEFNNANKSYDKVLENNKYLNEKIIQLNQQISELSKKIKDFNKMQENSFKKNNIIDNLQIELRDKIAKLDKEINNINLKNSKILIKQSNPININDKISLNEKPNNDNHITLHNIEKYLIEPIKYLDSCKICINKKNNKK